MPRRRSSGSSVSSLRGMRSNLRGASTYDEFLKESNSQRKKEIRAESTLKYGGGFGRKVLYGMTNAIAGEKTADKFSNMFRDRGATEEAYQTLYGDESGGGSNREQTNTLSRIQTSISETETNLEEIQDQNTEILNILEDISNKLSPKDITVGKGAAAQTFRYDPLAPEGKKVTVVTSSGKAGRFASKKESFSVLSKAAYLSNIEQASPNQSKLERLPSSPEVVKSAIEQARMPMEYVQQEPRQPKTYDEYIGARKNLSKAEKTLRYGGKGLGRRALFGITKGIVGERAALKVATLGRNRKQTEEAFQTVKNRGLPESETQLSAKAAIESRAKSEFSEADKEWKEDVTERLDRIERKIGDGGILSMLSSFLSTAIGAITSLLTGLLSAAALAPMIVAALSNPVVLAALAAAAIGYTIYKGYEKSQEEARVVDDVTEKIRAGEDVSQEELQAARQSEDNFMMWAGGMAGGGMGAPMMTPQQMGMDSIVDTELKRQAERKAEIDRNIPSSIRRPTEFSPNVPIDFGDLESARNNRIQSPMLPGVVRPSAATTEELLIPSDPDIVNQEWQKIPGARRDPETGAIILPDPKTIPTELEPAENSAGASLRKNQNALDESSEEFSREVTTPPPPQVIVTPPPPAAPSPMTQQQPSQSPIIIAARDAEPSATAFSISRFDYPNFYPMSTA